MKFWYVLIKIIFWIYQLLFVRKISVSGQEHLFGGPKIVVANHPNVTDSVVLPAIFPEELTFLIQAEAFTLPIIGFLLRRSGQIAVVKGQGRKALDAALERLSNGGTVVIFPEGKLNHGDGLHRAGSGAAILARQSGAPIIPIGFFVAPGDTLMMQGNVQDRKTFGRWQVRGTCHINIGKPWWVTKTTGDQSVRLRSRDITKQMMAQIKKLVEMGKAQADQEEASYTNLKLESL